MCPHLYGKYTKLCQAVKCLVAISSRELESYCESGDFRDCPIYQAHARRRGRKMSLREYCAAQPKGDAWGEGESWMNAEPGGSLVKEE